jgi:hypothetical protein
MKILYANGSRDRFVRAYDVQPEGTVTNGRLLIDITLYIAARSSVYKIRTNVAGLR